MQVTLNIEEYVFNELKKKAQMDGISIEKELEQLILSHKKQSFFDWAKETNWKAKENDISLHHDMYLYGGNKQDE